MSQGESSDSGLLQLVYASAATVAFSQRDLNDLLTVARAKNEAIDVTGVLLFHEGTFFQVLEGEPEAVEAVYDKIAQDQRHDNVLLLAKNHVAERNFGQWSMGFISGEREMRELPGFVDFFAGRTFMDLQGDHKRMQQILEGFRRGRWRRSSSNALLSGA